MSTMEINPPELWILNLEVGDVVDIDPMFPLMITNVALTATAANPNEHTSLQLTYAPAGFHAEKDAIVATLFKHRTDSAKVHLRLEPGLTYTLKVLGPNSIDIIGEWQPSPPENTHIKVEAELKETKKGKEKEVIKEKPEPKPRNQATTKKTPTESVATTRSRTKPAATRSPMPQASSSTAATKPSAVQAKKKSAPAQAKAAALKNPPAGAKKRKVEDKEQDEEQA